MSLTSSGKAAELLGMERGEFIRLADSARLGQIDLSVHHSTLLPRKLVKNDASIVTQVVKSIEPAHPRQAKLNRTFEAGTKILRLVAEAAQGM